MGSSARYDEGLQDMAEKTVKAPQEPGNSGFSRGAPPRADGRAPGRESAGLNSGAPLSANGPGQVTKRRLRLATPVEEAGPALATRDLAERFWAEPCTERRLALFPLFNGLTIPELCAADIDDSYQPDASIQDLVLGIRARRVLSSLNVSDVRRLLVLEPATLFRLPNCGTGTIREIQQKVQQFILQTCGLAKAPSLPPEVFGEFERMADSFLFCAIEDDRKVAVLKGRLGLGSGGRKTQKTLATGLHRTRERVRQMENECVAAIRTRPSLALLAPFWRAVQATLECAGGVLELAGFAEQLTRCYGWPYAPDPRSLGAFISLHPAFSTDNPGLINLEDGPCLDCDTATTLLAHLVGNAQEIALSEAISLLCESCRRLCKKHVAEPRAWSTAYIRYILGRKGATEGRVRIAGDRLYTTERWELRFGRLRTALRRILLDQGKPLPFKKVCALLRPWRERVLSEQAVRYTLKRTPGIWVWGRGTYVHRSCVSPPEDLLLSIQAWVQKRLGNGLRPLSIHQAFCHFSRECQSAGIPTEEALYTCLRAMDNPALRYGRAPYVRLR